MVKKLWWGHWTNVVALTTGNPLFLTVCFGTFACTYMCSIEKVQQNTSMGVFKVVLRCPHVRGYYVLELGSHKRRNSTIIIGVLISVCVTYVTRVGTWICVAIISAISIITENTTNLFRWISKIAGSFQISIRLLASRCCWQDEQYLKWWEVVKTHSRQSGTDEEKERRKEERDREEGGRGRGRERNCVHTCLLMVYACIYTCRVTSVQGNNKRIIQNIYIYIYTQK